MLLPTGYVYVRGSRNRKAVAKLLLDSGSQRNFIASRLVKALQIPTVGHELLALHVFGGQGLQEPRNMPVVRIKLLPNVGAPIEVLALVVDMITADLLPAPSKYLRQKLMGVDLAERIDGPTMVELLLNAASTFRVLNGSRREVGDQTLLIGTRFGEVMVGADSHRQRSVLAATVAAPCLEHLFSLKALGVDSRELDMRPDSAELLSLVP